MAKWSGPKRTAGLTLTGKESRDALERLNSLKPKWQERFFQTQGIHRDGHLYIAWSNLSGRLQQGEWIYPDDAHRWLHKLERKHKNKKTNGIN